MIYRLALAIAAAGVVAPMAVAPVNSAPRQSEDARFTAFGNRVIDEYLRLDPANATQLGEHRYDNRLPDVSAAGRAATRSFAQRTLTQLARFDRSRLSREHQVDALLLADQLRYVLFSDQKLQDWAWNPLSYSGTAGGSLFSLISREFAPLPVRLRSATGRPGGVADVSRASSRFAGADSSPENPC